MRRDGGRTVSLDVCGGYFGIIIILFLCRYWNDMSK